MLHTFYFSPSGTTKRYAESMSAEYFDTVTYHNIATDSISIDMKQDDDILIILPVYGGRLPRLASDKLMSLKGNGQRTVVCVVYGNRAYDDALLELCEIAKDRGFNVVAASAFIAEHCIFPKVAAGRPDGFDLDIAKRFVNTAWRKVKPLELTRIKGNYPYKKIAKVPLHPVTDNRICKKCGTCVRECPYNAIDSETIRTDPARCSACGRCLHVCERDARKFRGLMYSIIGKIFAYQNRDAKEPEIFL